jgi:hypothetical protein
VRPVAAGGVSVTLGAVAVAGMIVLAGVRPVWAVLIGLPFIAFMLLFLLAPGGVEPIWAPLPDPSTRPSEHLATALESRLSEAADYQPRFRSRVQPRLARLAVAKLRRHGIEDLHDPRASGVLGAEVYRLAVDQDATLPDPKTTAALFRTLEES